jgi:hypothetical protein
MAERRLSKVNLIFSLVVLALFVGTVVATVMMVVMGDWDSHAWGLKLALRITWGCWVVVCLAWLLTRVTIFGWSFRRYLRWPGGPTQAPPMIPRRPTLAPWYKSAAASFSITVVMVSLTGAVTVTIAVLWMLVDTIGERVFWLVFKILGSAWWVLCVATVLTRVAIFGVQKKRAQKQAEQKDSAGQEVSLGRSAEGG